MTKCQHIQCMLAVPGCVPLSAEYRKRSRSSLSPPPVIELSLVSDNKDPLRKETVSPEYGISEELVMWMISDNNKYVFMYLCNYKLFNAYKFCRLYFHSINGDCHRVLNSTDLERKSFCIE